jgi:protein-S-isoprenylcysteine O-methyltransferase Ste14
MPGACGGRRGVARSNTATGMGVALLLGLLARSAARAEEPYLEAKLGDEYRDYRSRVRRWT